MKAVITLDQNAPAKVQVENGGSLRTVYLNMQDLADYLVSSVKEQSVVVTEKPKTVTVSPALPLNTMKYAKMDDDTDLIFLAHPETKANITYHNDVFENVPFPNLVFCFGVRNNRLSHKYVFAYKDRFLRDDTKLFRFPFANVFGDGGLCYHDNDPVHDLVQLQSFPHNWLSNPFNDHLYHQKETNMLNQPLRGVLESTQHQSFNYEMLVPLNVTFSDWSKKLLNQEDE